MRHLLTYKKLFESTETREYLQSCKTTIGDILLDIKDDGFEVTDSFYTYSDRLTPGKSPIGVEIEIFAPKQNRSFDFDSIEPTISHLISYLKSEGFELLPFRFYFHRGPNSEGMKRKTDISEVKGRRKITKMEFKFRK